MGMIKPGRYSSGGSSSSSSSVDDVEGGGGIALFTLSASRVCGPSAWREVPPAVLGDCASAMSSSAAVASPCSLKNFEAMVGRAWMALAKWRLFERRENQEGAGTYSL